MLSTIIKSPVISISLLVIYFPSLCKPIRREEKEARLADTRKIVIVVLSMVRGKLGVIHPLTGRYIAKSETSHMANVARKKKYGPLLFRARLRSGLDS